MKDRTNILRAEICRRKKRGENYSRQHRELSLHYLYEPSKGGFKYQFKLSRYYLTDFIYLDIFAAKEFVLRAIQDGIRTQVQAIIFDQNSFDDEKIFIKKYTSCQFNTDHAEIYNNFIEDFYEENQQFESFEILFCGLFAQIDDAELLNETVISLSKKNRHKIAEILYRNANSICASQLVADKLQFNKYSYALKQLQVHWRESKFGREEDMVIDYYLASLSMNIHSMLDMAEHKNSMMFTILFCQEMDRYHDRDFKIFLMKEDFYKKFLENLAIKNFYYFKKCRSAFQKIYRCHERNSFIRDNNKKHLAAYKLFTMINGIYQAHPAWENTPALIIDHQVCLGDYENPQAILKQMANVAKECHVFDIFDWFADDTALNNFYGVLKDLNFDDIANLVYAKNKLKKKFSGITSSTAQVSLSNLQVVSHLERLRNFFNSVSSIHDNDGYLFNQSYTALGVNITFLAHMITTIVGNEFSDQSYATLFSLLFVCKAFHEAATYHPSYQFRMVSVPASNFWRRSGYSNSTEEINLNLNNLQVYQH